MQSFKIPHSFREAAEKDRMTNISERIRQFPGVLNVILDPEEDLIKIIYDDSIIGIFDLYHAMIDLGIDISTSNATLEIQNMNCISCIAHVEGALSDLHGVLEVTVNLSENNARVSYLSDVVSIQNMVDAVRESGYVVVNSNEIIS